MEIQDVYRLQERHTDAIAGLTDMVGTSNGLLLEILEWLRRPPSNELAEALRALTVAVTAQTATVNNMDVNLRLALLEILRRLQHSP